MPNIALNNLLSSANVVSTSLAELLHCLPDKIIHKKRQAFQGLRGISTLCNCQTTGIIRGRYAEHYSMLFLT